MLGFERGFPPLLSPVLRRSEFLPLPSPCGDRVIIPSLSICPPGCVWSKAAEKASGPSRALPPLDGLSRETHTLLGMKTQMSRNGVGP